MRCQIKLNSITDVKEFVNITFKAENDVDLICGKYHIDGKSIMGIFLSLIHISEPTRPY